MLQRKVYEDCRRCEILLQRSEWLLEPADWVLEELGSGGNGQVFKATCPETGCEHAAKFMSYDSGKWECAMIERVQGTRNRHIVRAICSGLTRNQVGLNDGTSYPRFVLLSELMSEDLFSAVFAPCGLSRGLFARACGLKHIAYQLLHSIKGEC